MEMINQTIEYIEHMIDRMKLCKEHLDDEKIKENIGRTIENAENRVIDFKEKLKTQRTKKCLYCGKEFIASNSNQYCCSSTCKNKYKAKNKETIQRCTKFGVKKIDDSITLPKVYEKYKGICYICGCKTNIKGNWWEKDYPNIEHVKPICKGGTHTWDNVRLACRKCNLQKGTKDLEEIKTRR